MREQILHFIWEHQYYDAGECLTEDQLPIQVIKPGKPHNNAGPDFEQAKLIIGSVEWNGDVEIHIKSSDWNAHKHHLDKAYNKVILHVVWVNDKIVKREDGTLMPTLVLQPIIDKEVLNKAENLLDSLAPIPCATQFQKVPQIIITNEIQRSLIMRLERKSAIITAELIEAKGNWNEVAYRIFMRQMGMKINGNSFYELALIIPYFLIRKYAHSLFQIESLLFGASGLLNDNFDDEYVLELKKEYKFLAHKHKINRQLNPENWKFLRLRPANFPTLRLAQAAAIFASPKALFDAFLQNEALSKTLECKYSTYWKTHYKFGVKASGKVPVFGKASIDLIGINVVAPLLTAYGKSINDDEYTQQALTLLEQLKPEKNKITRIWEGLSLKAINAGESQGLIELYNEYCSNKKCLHCGIGFSLIKQ